MKRLTLILLLILMMQGIGFVSFAQSDTLTQPIQRPKVAVVLSGGGAKGMAHVAILQKLEEAGIPIDIVVGTSMGSIIGGLYSAGYSPNVMRQIIGNIDWMKLILDNPDYGTGMLSSRKNMETYILRIKTERARRISQTGFGGLIEGANVQKLLTNLLEHIPDSLDFNDLPVPFACVATDLETGTPVVMNSGNLVKSIRTSMSIPTIFTPIIHGERSYVDGGIVNNFPIDVARQMGADIVIGANLPNTLNTAQISNNTFEVLNYILNLRGLERTQNNVKDADIYIPIDVSGYTAGSFDHKSIDSLFVRGEQAFKQKEDEVYALRDRLRITEKPDRIRKAEISYDEEGKLHIEEPEEVVEDAVLAQHELNKLTRVFISEDANIKSAMGIGLRFDSYKYASFLLEGDMILKRKRNIDLNFRARLGSRMEFGGGIDMSIYKSVRMGLYYKYKSMNLDISSNGNRSYNYDLSEHLTDFYFTQEWSNFFWEAGLEYNKSYFDNGLVLFNEIIENNTGRSLIPYLITEYNTLDTQYFPTKGVKMSGILRFYTMNRFQTNQDIDFRPSDLTMLIVDAKAAYTVGRRFTMIPHYSMIHYCNRERFSTMLLNRPFYGGLGTGVQLENQISFAGFVRVQSDYNSICVGGLTLQHRLKDHHFVTATIDHFRSFWYLGEAGHSSTTGISLGYNLQTAVGPLTLEGRWNDRNSGTTLFLNLGYYF